MSRRNPRPTRRPRCIYCGDAVCESDLAHRECATAWGLDYDPRSHADARRWLRARRAALIEAAS